MTRIGAFRALGALLRRDSFARLYPSFAEAGRGGAYDEALLTRFRVERARLNLEAIEPSDLPPGFALLFAAAHLGPGPVRVTDVGGACGEWGHALRRDARRSIEYTVAENGALAEACAGDPFFTWARFTDAAPASCDVFVSSGTLQYLEEPYALLEFAFSSATLAVVLARNGFADREIFRVHRSRLRDNGLGPRLPVGYDLDAEIRYAHRTISYDRVMAAATARGWRLALSLECASGVLPYRGQVWGRDLLFLRR